MALNIAKRIRNEHFIYGWQQDPSEEYYQYIYYFQYKDKQVSFHNDILYKKVPEFKGQWIGYKNESFPFNLRIVKT